MLLADAQTEAARMFGDNRGRAFEFDNSYYVGFNLAPDYVMVVGRSDKDWQPAFEQAERWVSRGV
jgi:hypothetical protein